MINMKQQKYGSYTNYAISFRKISIFISVAL